MNPSTPRASTRRTVAGAGLGLGLFLLLSGVAGAAPPGDGVPQKVWKSRLAAEVNGVPITEKELLDNLALDDRWLRTKHELGSAAARERPQHMQRVLNELIDELLLMQEAKRRGIVLTPEEEHEVQAMYDRMTKERRGSKEALQAYLQERGIPQDLYFKRFRRSFLGRKVLERELSRLDSFIRPADIQAYYRHHARRFQKKPRLVYRHIWIDRAEQNPKAADRKVTRCLEALAKHESWDQVCLRFSDGLNRDHGGRMVCEGLSACTPSLRDAIGALKPGEVSKPIEIPARRDRYRTRPGAVVIVRLDEHTEGGVLPIEAVEDEVKKLLRDLRHEEVMQELRSRLREQAQVEIHLGES